MKCLQWLMVGIAAMLTIGLAHAEEDWTLVNNKEGIQSYCRKASGTGLLEIKAVMVVDAPIENVGEMIRDVPGYVNWMPYCGEGEILAGNRDDANVRVLLDLPWPVTDREVFLNARVSYDLDHGRAFIDLTNQADHYQMLNTDVIRVPAFQGRYTIEFITREKTGIIYQYSLDFAGALPKSLTNFISKSYLLENLKNLREQVNSNRYDQMGNKSNDRKLCETILLDSNRLDSVVKARLSEFIQDEEFVDWLSREVSLYDLITAEKGRLSEMLLFSWSSESVQLEAVRFVVQKVLEAKNVSPELIDNLLANEDLTRAIHTGDKEVAPERMLASQWNEAT
ncbi:MAG: START domain-containing protein [Desulfatibacillum sp.]|nr:START domain-containing protein [Desulfatibacillum sp.]